MLLLLTVALVVAAVVLLVLGLVTSAAAAYLGAAAASAAAVLILSRFLSVAREQTFVSHAPPATEPDWDQPVVPPVSIEDASDGLVRRVPTVAIDGYEDLIASEIIPSLETLSIEQLEAVILREKTGLQRDNIISRAETLIDLTRGSDLDLREEPVTAAPQTTRTRKRKTASEIEVEAIEAAITPVPTATPAKRKPAVAKDGTVMPATPAKRTRAKKTPAKDGPDLSI